MYYLELVKGLKVSIFLQLTTLVLIKGADEVALRFIAARNSQLLKDAHDRR